MKRRTIQKALMVYAVALALLAIFVLIESWKQGLPQ